MRAKACFFFRGAMIVIVYSALCGPVMPESNEPAKIEFRCKIVPPSKEKGQKLKRWEVELRSFGKLVRAASAAEWQTIHFRNLEPGIYTVCLVGSYNRESCESVDMYPPNNHTSYKFSKELSTPSSVLHRDSLYKVDSRALVVPQAARIEMTRAGVAQLQNEDQDAMRHLETAVNIYPEYTDALNNLGTYYRRNGELEKAIECFTKVTQLDPEFYGGWVNLSGSLLALSRFPEALEKSQRAYQLRPHEPIVLSHYARTLYHVHNYELARKYFKELEAVDPENASYPQLFLAQIALAGGNIPEAKVYMAQFLKMHPNVPEAKEYREVLDGLDLMSTPDAATKGVHTELSSHPVQSSDQ